MTSKGVEGMKSRLDGLEEPIQALYDCLYEHEREETQHADQRIVYLLGRLEKARDDLRTFLNKTELP